MNMHEEDNLDPFGNDVSKMRELLRRDNIGNTDGIGANGQHVSEMELGSYTPSYPISSKARGNTVRINK